LRDAQLWNDKSTNVVISLSDKDFDRLWYYLYVDNMGVVGRSRARVGEGITSVVERLESRGLHVHEREDCEGSIPVLGVVLDCLGWKTTPRPDKVWRLRQATSYVVHRGRCSGHVLSVLVGYSTFLGLVQRECLSVFHYCYAFISRYRHEVRWLWTSVKEELIAFAGLAPLLSSDWVLPWNPMLVASDASLAGWAVATSFASPPDVAEVGRVKERFRFRDPDAEAPRRRALGAAGFIEDESGVWVPRPADQAWEMVDGFPEVPTKLLVGRKWKTVIVRPWLFDGDPINHLEGRALLKAVERVIYSSYGINMRQVALVDNLTVALCFGRYRAKTMAMLRLVRKVAALCLAANVRLTVRWVPSELNSADEGSRVYGDGASENLIKFFI